MSVCLVTGAAGFIGSHTTEALLAAGHSVIGIDNFRTGSATNLQVASRNSRFRFYEGDVTLPGVVEHCLGAHRIEVIIHLAALVSVPESIAQPALNRRLNFDATCSIAWAAVAAGTVRRLVFASSAAVYGAATVLPLEEETEGVPLSPYGQAKLDSERWLLGQPELAKAGIVVRCQRYFNVYGPRQDPSSPYSGVVSRFQEALARGEGAVINGDGHQTRDFVSVHDVSQANLMAATRSGVPSGCANICTGRRISLNELWETMCSVRGTRCPARPGPVREGDIRHSCGSPARAERELGFVAERSLADGLRELGNA